MKDCLTRRHFLQRLATAAALPGLLSQWAARPAYAAPKRSGRPRVVILGMDGMDPELLQKFVDQGVMPNFKAFIAKGSFKPLQTIMPPQSPVAWSTFITGMDPGGHGIYDFLHRDPANYSPQLSLAGAVPAKWPVKIGQYSIPLVSSKPQQMRHGTAFWQLLEEAGISTVIHQIPANFPPVESSGRAISGMGTPDIRGTSGTFSFYSDQIDEKTRKIGGAEIQQVELKNNRVDARLIGPPNSLIATQDNKPPSTEIPFSVFIDPTDTSALFKVQGNEFILKQGEWSEWVEVEFELMPHLASVSAICRFYLQQARPHFRLYVTPLQINPANPAMPIATPEDYSRDLQKELGYFYTQELPADTKAYSEGVFSGQEFWEQSQFVFREQRRALDYYLERIDQGPDLLFFYFSSLDQGCHMFWRNMDSSHPGYTNDPILSTALQKLYMEMDEALGRTMQVLGPEDTLIVMSDHGFGSFHTGVNLNSWLFEQGYCSLRFPNRRDEYKYFENCNWKRTKAYALGLNGLYINLEGREGQGIVKSGSAYESLVQQLREDLLQLRDPQNGQAVVSSVIVPGKDFRGPHADQGPDLIVGYRRGYRSSWKSPLGEFPEELFEKNVDAWSGDHCVDSTQVPGVLLSNRNICIERPALYDLTVAILKQFQVKALPEMIGKNCLE